MAQERMVDGNPMAPRPFTVKGTKTETQDTFTLELGQEGGGEFRFSPGQFNMVYLFGGGEVPISISGDPQNTRSLIHTIRGVGAVTKPMESLKKGDVLGIRGPFGSSWPMEEAEGNDVVVIAGGIGLAPLRPVLYQLLAHRGKYGRIVLLYGTRSPEDLLYPEELHGWRGHFDMDVYVSVDRGTGGWRGHVGVVTTLIPKASFDPYHSTVMICGPEIMMRFTIMDLMKQGVEPEHIFVSMERNMKCAVGFCGHCQYGPTFICKDGPVFRYRDVRHLLTRREL